MHAHAHTYAHTHTHTHTHTHNFRYDKAHAVSFLDNHDTAGELNDRFGSSDRSAMEYVIDVSIYDIRKHTCAHTHTHSGSAQAIRSLWDTWSSSRTRPSLVSSGRSFRVASRAARIVSGSVFRLSGTPQIFDYAARNTDGATSAVLVCFDCRIGQVRTRR